MQVRFGNLTISKFEDRCGCKFEKEDYEWLKQHRQDDAQHIEKDRFHIFDMPFSIIVGENIQDKLVEILTKYNNIKAFNESLNILANEEE